MGVGTVIKLNGINVSKKNDETKGQDHSPSQTTITFEDPKYGKDEVPTSKNKVTFI